MKYLYLMLVSIVLFSCTEKKDNVETEDILSIPVHIKLLIISEEEELFLPIDGYLRIINSKDIITNEIYFNQDMSLKGEHILYETTVMSNKLKTILAQISFRQIGMPESAYFKLVATLPNGVEEIIKSKKPVIGRYEKNKNLTISPDGKFFA